MNADRLLAHFDRIADAPDAVPRLRRFILDLAVRGKLVEQDPNDEPASELLKSIAAEKARLVTAGEIRKTPPLTPVVPGEQPFAVPVSWEWVSSTYPAHGVSDLGKKIKTKEVLESGAFPVVDQGKVLVRGYCNDLRKVVKVSEPLIVFGDHTRETKLIDFDFVVGADGVKILQPVGIEARFYHLVLQWLPLENRGYGRHYRLLKSSYIPLPPLAEQHRIVAKVDELMSICDRLEVARAEREATRDRLAEASLARINAPDPNPDAFQNHAAFALENLAPLTTRVDQIKALRQTILNLAVRGRLVEQDPNDEPTGEALLRIGIEREGLVQRKIIRREKPLAKIGADEPPFDIPLHWRWKRIGEVALFTQYGTSTKSIPSEQGVPVLTMGNIQDGAVVWGNEKKTPATSEEFPALFLKKFDLLYNRTNSAELVGKTGIYLGEDDCKTFASYLIRVQLSKISSSPRYVNLAINAPVFRETQIVPLIKKQTGQANVNGTALKNMLVPVPPLTEQHRIVAKVDVLMALCDKLEASLADGDDTRGRLLDAMLHEVLVMGADRKSVA